MGLPGAENLLRNHEKYRLVLLGEFYANWLKEFLLSKIESKSDELDQAHECLKEKIKESLFREHETEARCGLAIISSLMYTLNKPPEAEPPRDGKLAEVVVNAIGEYFAAVKRHPKKVRKLR